MKFSNPRINALVIISLSLMTAILAPAQRTTAKSHSALKPLPPVAFAISGYDVRRLPLRVDHALALYDRSQRYYLMIDKLGVEYAIYLVPAWGGYTGPDAGSWPKGYPRPYDDNADALDDPFTIHNSHIRLETENHIHIGETRSQVVRSLGPANYEIDSDSLSYYYPGGRFHGLSYLASYTFRNGKLLLIAITVQKGPQVAG